MGDTGRKAEIIKRMSGMEYHPAVFDEEVSMERYTKLPWAEISALGVAFAPLVASASTVTKTAAGGMAEQLYRLNARGYVGNLAAHTDGSGFLSTIMNSEGIAGQGAFVPVDEQAVTTTISHAFNPTMIFMAVALASIDRKLESIQEAQKEIIEFLEQKEKSKLRGNLIFLADVLNNYKHNWSIEQYKQSNHIKVLDIKQDAEQSILFYREQIGTKLKKQSFIHSDKDVNDKLNKIISQLKEYQLALYMYAFSSFLDVMLLENFESAFLDGIVQKIEDYAFQYRELYTECYDKIEGYSKSTIQSGLISGLASINKAVGNAASKIPVISKSQIDETLIETGSKLGKLGSKRLEQTMAQLTGHQSSEVYTFIENINTVNRLYNQPVEILFDRENIYIGLSA